MMYKFIGTLGVSVLACHAAHAASLPLDVLDTVDVNYSQYESDCGGNMGCIVDATSLGTNGGGDHYDDAFGVTVDGLGYAPTQGTAGVQSLSLETLSFGDLSVSASFMTTGPILRQLITVQNTGTTSVSTQIGWHNNTGNDSGQQTYGTSDGDLTAETSDQWVVTGDGSALSTAGEVNAWVFNGFGGLAPTSVLLVDDNPDFGCCGEQGLTAYFDLLLGAGQTKSLMLFAVAEGLASEGISGAQSIFDEATYASLTSDLSATQLGQIQNFGVSAAVPLPAAFPLLLVALGGLGVAARRRKAA